MNDLDGKRALVTGAAQGIGLAIATRLAQGGASVVLTDLDEQKVVAAAAALEGARAGLRADVTNPEDVESSLGEAAERLGGLDVIVNNAGVEIGKPLVETGTEEFRTLLDINVIGVFHGIKYGAPHLAPTKGTLINMASVAGLGGAPLLGAYCASKGAVMRLTEVAAIELREAGIRCVAVCPAFVDSPMVDRLIPAIEELTGQDFGALAGQVQSRLGTVEDVAEGVAFLASDDSSWITGSPLVLDGGLTGSLI